MVRINHKNPQNSPLKLGTDPYEATKTPPAILIVTFSDALTAVKVSNFLVWFFYFDIVELPDSPNKWFGHIPTMDMKGWISLGRFFKNTNGEDLMMVNLDSICLQLNIRTAHVLECAVELADPNQMCWTRMAAAIQTARHQRKDEAQTLEAVQHICYETRGLISALRPAPGTTFPIWQRRILERLGDFVDVVIHPRITFLRSGSQIATGRSHQEESQIFYLYEAMQQPRKVPLSRYGIFSDLTIDRSLSNSNSTNSTVRSGNMQLDEAALEQQAYNVDDLRSENQALRTRVFALECATAHLRSANEKLARMAAASRKPTPVLDQMVSRKPLPAASHLRSLQRSSSTNPSVSCGSNETQGTSQSQPAVPVTFSGPSNGKGTYQSSGHSRMPTSEQRLPQHQSPATVSSETSRDRDTAIIEEGQKAAHEFMGSLFKSGPLPSLPLTDPSGREQYEEWERRRDTDGSQADSREEIPSSNTGNSFLPGPFFRRNWLLRRSSEPSVLEGEEEKRPRKKRSFSSEAIEMVMGVEKPDMSTNF